MLFGLMSMMSLAVVIKGVECMEEIRLTSMHNVLMVQLSKTAQCIF